MARLKSRTVRREDLREDQRARMLSLMRLCYDGVDPARFNADLDAKQFVVLLLEKGNETLVGFSTIRLARETFGSTEAEVLFSGDTVIHPDFWGEKALDAAFTRFLLWRCLAHPFRPLFWLLLSAGYKTYLIILNYFPSAFPRTNAAPNTQELNFRNAVAGAWWGARYDERAGVVRLDGNYHVRSGIAPIGSAAASHPDVAFFASQNPGHVQGDELVCLARVRLIDLFWAFVRIAWKRTGRLAGAAGRLLIEWKRA